MKHENEMRKLNIVYVKTLQKSQGFAKFKDAQRTIACDAQHRRELENLDRGIGEGAAFDAVKMWVIEHRTIECPYSSQNIKSRKIK